MKTLLPFLRLYKLYLIHIITGITLAFVTLLASIFLLGLSSWFLAATATVGFTGIYTFNYMLPAVGVRGAAILRTAARYAERLLSHNTTFAILSFLRTLSFKKIMPLSPSQLQHYQKSDLLNRFIADIDNLDHFYLKLLSPFIAALLINFAIYFSLSYFNKTLSTIISAVFLITLIFIPPFFYQISKPISEMLTKQKSEYRKRVISYLQGQSELMIFNARSQFRDNLDEVEKKWLINQKKQAALTSLVQNLVILIMGLLTIAVIWLSTTITLDYDSPLIAIFVFVCLASSEILAPITNAFIYLGQVTASAKRITELFNQKPDIVFTRKSNTAITSPFSITLENIVFSYPEQITPALNHISLTIEDKQHVALIGKTGGGKSTLLKLITRWADPQQGTICFNQIPITDFDEKTLRQMMAVVPQRIDILSDTLRNNLLIADQSASDEKLVEIIYQVGLSKLLGEEAGLSVWIGEKGLTLSGGEIRRIGIARALLHKAPLVLMDEPTESLDSETERQIITLISKVYKHKTVLMATHRLVDNQLFDKIYSINSGQLTPA